ncbi:MAG: hypothetical protein NXI16_18155 [Alphaproteobacteria bacterium]|nr:hypothetical protein [Alphaproteobacteria bacterium]
MTDPVFGFLSDSVVKVLASGAFIAFSLKAGRDWLLWNRSRRRTLNMVEVVLRHAAEDYKVFCEGREKTLSLMERQFETNPDWTPYIPYDKATVDVLTSLQSAFSASGEKAVEKVVKFYIADRFTYAMLDDVRSTEFVSYTAARKLDIYKYLYDQAEDTLRAAEAAHEEVEKLLK